MAVPDDVLTTGEAAALCGLARSTLRRAVSQRLITAWHTPGGHLRFSRAECLEFARSLGRVELVGRAQERAAAEQPAGARAAPARPPSAPR